MAGAVRLLKLNKYIFMLGAMIAACNLLLNKAIYLQYRGLKQIQDFPDYLSTIYLTSRGDIFGHYAGWCQQMERMTFLGAHISPVILLFAAFYRIVNHPLALFSIQIFCVSLASVAIFYIAQERLKNQPAAFLFAAAFLLYQPAASAAVTSFQPEVFAVPLTAFMFLALVKRRYKWCVFLSILLLSLKENTGFIVSMFGLYSFFRGDKKLGAFLFLSGFLWSVICIGFLIPYFRAGRPAQSLLWFGHLGGSWPEILGNLTLHPFSTVKRGLAAYWPMKRDFQWYVLGPLLYLPLLYPEVLLIALPVIAQIYLARHHLMASSLCYYHAPMDALLFIAAIYAIGRLFSRSKRIILVAALAVLTVNIYISLFRSQFFKITWGKEGMRIVRDPVYRVSERDNLIWRVLDEYRIPPDTSVATSFPFMEAFAGSHRASNVSIFRQEVPEYIFLDALNYRFGDSYNGLIRLYLNEISAHPWYKLAFAKEGIYIFKRKPGLGSDEFLKEVNNFSWRAYLAGQPEAVKDMVMVVEGGSKDMVIYKKRFDGDRGPFFKARIFIDQPGWKMDYLYDGRDLYSFDRIWSQAERVTLPPDALRGDFSNKLKVVHSDYRNISGAELAFRKDYYLINNGQQELLLMTERIKDVKVNSGLGDSLFDAAGQLREMGAGVLYARNPAAGPLAMEQYKEEGQDENIHN